MSITQTVEVPPSRRLMIDVPREIPVGPVVLTFTPADAGKQRKLGAFRQLTREVAELNKHSPLPPLFDEMLTEPFKLREFSDR
jgi:hypothetical protein